jgi:uncharacterized membrane protein
MSEIASARLNNLRTSTEADFVSHSEQLITLTIGQLQDLITAAVEKAIQPLADHIESLEATVAVQAEKITALQATQDTHAENDLIQLRLINDLREAAKKEPQPLQKDRGEILRALIAANGGKMLAKDARQKMRMSKQSFTNLLASLPDIESKPLHTDKRKRVLYLK